MSSIPTAPEKRPVAVLAAVRGRKLRLQFAAARRRCL